MPVPYRSSAATRCPSWCSAARSSSRRSPTASSHPSRAVRSTIPYHPNSVRYCTSVMPLRSCSTEHPLFTVQVLYSTVQHRYNYRCTKQYTFTKQYSTGTVLMQSSVLLLHPTTSTLKYTQQSNFNCKLTNRVMEKA